MTKAEKYLQTAEGASWLEVANKYALLSIAASLIAIQKKEKESKPTPRRKKL